MSTIEAASTAGTNAGSTRCAADELSRGQQPELRVLPPDESLEAQDAAGGQRDERLVVHDQLGALDRVPKVAGQRQPGEGRLVHGRRCPAPRLLRLGQQRT